MAVLGVVCISLGLWLADVSVQASAIAPGQRRGAEEEAPRPRNLEPPIPQAPASEEGYEVQQRQMKTSDDQTVRCPRGQVPVFLEENTSRLCVNGDNSKEETEEGTEIETKPTEKTTDDPTLTQSVTYPGEIKTTDDSQSTQTATQILLTSLKPDDEPEESMLPYTLGITVSLLVLSGIALSIYCYRQRQSAQESSHQQVTQSSAVAASHYEDVIPHDDDDNTEDSSRHQHVTIEDPSSASVQIHETGTGSDDGQYGRLDRDGRKWNDATRHGDLYDHATSPQRPTSAPTESNASQEESDVYNRLCRYPEKEIVIDNVYNSTH